MEKKAFILFLTLFTSFSFFCKNSVYFLCIILNFLLIRSNVFLLALAILSALSILFFFTSTDISPSFFSLKIMFLFEIDSSEIFISTTLSIRNLLSLIIFNKSMIEKVSFFLSFFGH